MINPFICKVTIITSAKEVTFSPRFVCGFVHLFVSKEDSSKTDFDEIFRICAPLAEVCAL